MRRLRAAAGLAALGLTLTVPPALAHPDAGEHRMAWGARPNPTTAEDGAHVYSWDEVVAASIELIDGVKRWEVVIRPLSGGQPSSCSEELARRNGTYPQKVYINCPWDTTRATKHTLAGATAPDDAAQPGFQRPWQAQDLGPSVNGKYAIEVRAWNSGQEYNCGLLSIGCQRLPGDEEHRLYQSGVDRWREVWVANGVSEPTRATNGYDAAANTITVTWAPNPEPDVFYEVQEKVGDGRWSTRGTVPGSGTRYDRVIEQPGKYQYQVRAVRPAPTAENTNAVKRSGYTATLAVEIAQLTSPSTASAAPSAPNRPVDVGDPGANIPGDPDAQSTSGLETRTPGPPSAVSPRAPGRGGGLVAGPRPSRSAGRSTKSTAANREEPEGEGSDEGFSSVLPYSQEVQGAIDDLGEGGDEEAGVMPGVPMGKPREARALLIPMAAALTLFVFAMQLTFLLRRSRPAMASTADDDFGDWMVY